MFKDDMHFFSGMRNIMKQMHSFSSRMLAPYGINRYEMIVLLWVYEEDGISQKIIVSRAGDEGIKMGIAIKSLEAKGFIERMVDPEDRRSLRLFVTGLGLKIREEIIDLKKAIEEFVITGISSEELCLMNAIFIKIGNQLSQNEFKG